MSYCTLDSIFESPWGIVEHRRPEIESGAYGHFEKILNEEIGRRFLSIDGVAQVLDAHPSTIRRWLKNSYLRFIIHEQRKLYFKEDALEVVERQKRIQAEAKARQREARNQLGRRTPRDHAAAGLDGRRPCSAATPEIDPHHPLLTIRQEEAQATGVRADQEPGHVSL